MKRTARIAAAGVLMASVASPALAQNCTISATGKSYTLSALTQPNQPFSLDDGYFLQVSADGGRLFADVMLDTGSNVLVIPHYAVAGFPSDPDNDTSGFVISAKSQYVYGSSGNGYLGYMVRTTVQLKDRLGTTVNSSPVELYAAVEKCSFVKGSNNTESPTNCEALVQPAPGKVGGPGMMGIGFQTPPASVTLKTGKLPTLTNVFQQIPGIETQGWIFQGDQVVVGLNQQVTRKFSAWAPLLQTTQDGTPAMSAEGCFQVTPPGGGTPTAAQCGTMLLDTGMSAMNVWVNDKDYPSVCPAAPTGTGAGTNVGFHGAPFPEGAQITITSPWQNGTPPTPIVNYTFKAPPPPPPPSAQGTGTKQPLLPAGTPSATMCSPTSVQSHSNIGRMPLALYSFARNQTCGTYSYAAN
ncbi:hypothetical protein [Azospirillum soli]|uniref:hypothetical protein n=1 Tax=Azospirillum soli TaxID=1304799 RepID=UPI001AE47575|nr:hypothetical protein [Azospirillum soli]MBP2312499.1 hypothetical protein [Azospirillum soli]